MEASELAVKRARSLRRHMSLPEVLLWRALRGGRLGVKFRRQHPVADYILDFYCCEARLAVEVDGMSHGMGGVAFHDARRDSRLAERGIRVVRLAARIVLKDIDVALATIRAALDERLGRTQQISPPLGGALAGLKARQGGGQVW